MGGGASQLRKENTRNCSPSHLPLLPNINEDQEEDEDKDGDKDEDENEKEDEDKDIDDYDLQQAFFSSAPS